MPHSPGKNLSFMIRSVFETFPDIPALLQQTAALYNPAQSAASVHPPVVSLPEEPLNHTREDHHQFLSDAALLHQSDCFPEISYKSPEAAALPPHGIWASPASADGAHLTYSTRWHHAKDKPAPDDWNTLAQEPPSHSKYNAPQQTKRCLHVHFPGRSMAMHVQYPECRFAPGPDEPGRNAFLCM